MEINTSIFGVLTPMFFFDVLEISTFISFYWWDKLSVHTDYKFLMFRIFRSSQRKNILVIPLKYHTFFWVTKHVLLPKWQYTAQRKKIITGLWSIILEIWIAVLYNSFGSWRFRNIFTFFDHQLMVIELCLLVVMVCFVISFRYWEALMHQIM